MNQVCKNIEFDHHKLIANVKEKLVSNIIKL